MTPKFGFAETFTWIKFTGMNKKMQYTRPKGVLSNRPTRAKKKRKLSPTWQGRQQASVEHRVLGGPSTDFLKRYQLNENSHPMDWFTAFMPLTPDANLEDAAVANVKGDRTTKFAVSNWTQ